MDRKRTLIISNATTLIKRYGIKKTTIEDIARECKLTTSALYYYFKNKDEIISEVFLHIQKEKMNKMKKELDQHSGDSTGKLEHYINIHLDFMINFRREYSINMYDIADQYDTIRKARDRGLQEETDLVKAILEEGTRAGLLAISNIDLTAELINHLISGISDFILHCEDDARLNKFIQEMPGQIIQILLKGLEVRKA
jgi:TetR/AcrR family transcriptional repressor of mexJK operon